MNTFFKVLTVVIDILLATTLCMEIKDRLDAKRENNINNKPVADPEPVTTD